MNEAEVMQKWINVLTKHGVQEDRARELVGFLWKEIPVELIKCPQCEKDDIDTERYCNNCGQRWYE